MKKILLGLMLLLSTSPLFADWSIGNGPNSGSSFGYGNRLNSGSGFSFENEPNSDSNFSLESALEIAFGLGIRA